MSTPGSRLWYIAREPRLEAYRLKGVAQKETWAHTLKLLAPQLCPGESLWYRDGGVKGLPEAAWDRKRRWVKALSA